MSYLLKLSLYPDSRTNVNIRVNTEEDGYQVRPMATMLTTWTSKNISAPITISTSEGTPRQAWKNERPSTIFSAEHPAGQRAGVGRLAGLRACVGFHQDVRRCGVLSPKLGLDPGVPVPFHLVTDVSLPPPSAPNGICKFPLHLNLNNQSEPRSL